jgi:predicted Fe-Mo cluster-binding NifX family protein
MTSSRTLIAIAVDDRGALWGGHFGMAPAFRLYAPDGALVTTRVNPYGAGQGRKHQHHDNPRLIIDLLPECAVFIGRRMGEESKRKLAEQFGIDALLTQEKTPEAALRAYLRTLSPPHSTDTP